MIYEIGVVLNGIPILNCIYSRKISYHQDKTLTCALISVIDLFYKSFFFEDLDFIKGKNHIITFSTETIENPTSKDIYQVIVYAITTGRKTNITEYVKQEIKPKLKRLLSVIRERTVLREKYTHSNLYETKKFQFLKKEIDNIFVEV